MSKKRINSVGWVFLSVLFLSNASFVFGEPCNKNLEMLARQLYGAEEVVVHAFSDNLDIETPDEDPRLIEFFNQVLQYAHFYKSLDSGDFFKRLKAIDGDYCFIPSAECLTNSISFYAGAPEKFLYDEVGGSHQSPLLQAAIFLPLIAPAGRLQHFFPLLAPEQLWMLGVIHEIQHQLDLASINSWVERNRTSVEKDELFMKYASIAENGQVILSRKFVRTYLEALANKRAAEFAAELMVKLGQKPSETLVKDFVAAELKQLELTPSDLKGHILDHVLEWRSMIENAGF